MARYGRYVTNGDYDYGQVAVNQVRASVYEKFPTNGWVTKIGFWGGGVIGDGHPKAVLALYATEHLNPSSLMGNTNVFTVTAKQSYGRDGQEYVHNVANTYGSPSINAIKVHGGYNYAIAIHGRSNVLGHAMVQASRINASNEKFYHRYNAPSIPNPMGYTSSSNEGWLSAWVEYTPNRAPSASTSGPSGLITTTTPRFKGSFSDADEVYGDQMTRFRIQVVRVSNNSIVWDSGSLAATSTEKANGAFNRAYGGSSIIAGQDYKWRCSVADEFGTWSAWTPYRTFEVNAGGYLDSQTTPSGKQTSVQPSPFSAVWRHANGLSMNMFRVRLMQGNTVLRTSGYISGSAADGGRVNCAWSTAFGSYSLDWGMTGLGWQIQGRDTGNMWSRWSPTRSFTTNAPPTVPSNLSPSNSAVTPTLPQLRCRSSDADNSSLTVKARIKSASGAVLATRTMAKSSGTTYTYQTTTADLTSWGTFRWDAYASDGHLFSGAVTSESSATKSSEAVFVYADAPRVVLTSPEESSVHAGSVEVAWQPIGNQKDIRFHFFHDDDTLLKRTEWITDSMSSTTFYAATTGFRTGHTYKVQVEVRDTNNLVGMSDRVSFSIEYAAPHPVTNLIASTEFLADDTVPSAIRLTWDAVEYENFAEYIVTRRESDEPDAADVVLARLTSPLDVIFIDQLPQSDRDYTYGVTVSVIEGLDTMLSDKIETQGRVTIEHVILQSVQNVQLRSALRFDQGRGFEHHDDMQLEMPWGNSAPFAVFGTAQYETFKGTFTLITDDRASAKDHVIALRSLWRSREVLCYRDERGRKFFGYISKFTEDDERIQHYSVKLDITEVAFEEGVG